MGSKVSAAAQIWFLIPLLALLSAFPPLSTDMYLPAIPYLGKLWSVDLLFSGPWPWDSFPCAENGK